MRPGALELRFSNRTRPLEPAGCAATDNVANRLVKRLLTLDDDSLAKLEGVASPRLVVVLGPAELLPWVDGIRYLGHEAEAPSFYFPTTLAPNIAAALLQRSLRKTKLDPPLMLLDRPPLLASLSEALPLSRAHLLAWRPK